MNVLGNKEWDKEWDREFEYYHTDLRFTFILRSLLKKNEKRILELAGGSFRDTININLMLKKKGVLSIGTDFCEKSVQLAIEKFPNQKDNLKVMDAFKLEFSEKEFDLSFHSGFWSFFEKDDWDKLIKEQVRVTKHRVIAVCHNAHNTHFLEEFKKDNLMNSVRFFTKDELKDIMIPYCRRVFVIPIFDRIYKFLYDAHLRGSLLIFCYIHLAKYFNIQKAERLMCIGELE